MTQVDINAILAKYGCKKQRPAASADARADLPRYPAAEHSPAGLDAIGTSPAAFTTERSYAAYHAFQVGELTAAALATKQQDQIPQSYFGQFEEAQAEPQKKPYDEPISLQAVSLIRDNGVYQRDPNVEGEGLKGSKTAIDDVYEQLDEVRRDVNALHREVLGLRMANETRFGKLEELLLLLLKRTE